ncbi:MAG: OmpA family protein, partial [Chryseobacterium sp.]
MKLSLAIVALALSVPTVAFAQDSIAVVSNEGYPNTFSSGSANVSPFTQKSKRFNDWAISFGAGVPLVQSADLTSIKNGNGKNLFGYSAYVSVDKAITHAFGLNLQYDRGETRQGWFNTKDAAVAGQEGARTQYDAISILGDLNFSNLLRRVDNKSTFRWALHGYAGLGTLAYRAYLKDASGQRLMTEIKPFKFGSFFGQAGAGLKFKVNRRIDLETRLMYVYTGDDEFDGGGAQYSSINKREEQVSDNFFNATVGVSLKLGKHESHLMWHDPLQEIYYKLDVLANKNQDIEVCKKGDADNDGVCDDWDRQLDTPAGARVDGAGVALDADLDGVIDLYDKCVTVPGPVENNGCPLTPTAPTTGPV